MPESHQIDFLSRRERSQQPLRKLLAQGAAFGVLGVVILAGALLVFSVIVALAEHSKANAGKRQKELQAASLGIPGQPNIVQPQVICKPSPGDIHLPNRGENFCAYPIQAVLPQPQLPRENTPPALYNPDRVKILYRDDGSLAGWIGPSGSRPPIVQATPAMPSSVREAVREAGGNGRGYGGINGPYQNEGAYARISWQSSANSGALSRSSIYTGPGVAENGSYYGQISDRTSLPKTTYVGGYFRRDGTYVRSHYRSR